MLDGLEDPDEKYFAMYGLVEGWAGIDPQATEAYLASIPPDQLPDRMMEHLWGAQAQSDPVAALERALLVTDPDEQAAALQAIVEQVGQTGDPSIAIPYIESLEPSIDRERLLETLLSRLSRNQPHEAYTKAMQYSEKNLQQNILPDIMQSWAAIDPQRGLEALLSLPSEIRQDKVFESFGYGLKTLEQAVPAFKQVDNVDEKCAIAKGLIRNYCIHPHDFLKLNTEQFGKLKTLIEGLPPGAERTSAQWDFASVWSSKENAQAIDWVQHHSHLEDDMKNKFSNHFQR